MRTSIRFSVFVALLVVSVMLAACGADEPTATSVPATNTPPPTAIPTTAPGQTPAPTATPDKMAMFQAEWDALLKAAQAEGQVVTFICCGTGRDIDKVIPAFEKKYGIRWINSTGASSQQDAKIQAEQKAGKYTLDIWHGGANTATTSLLPGGVLQPFKDDLFHPEVVDESLWYGPEGKGGHVWRDPVDKWGGQNIFAYVGNAGLAEISYNTDLVDPKTITSYWDLLKPEWKGKIVARDPRLGGTGASTATMIHHPDLGEAYYRRLITEMDITFTDDARQAAEWLALGKYSLCIFACGQEVQNAKKQGLPVEDQFPVAVKEGGRISVGGDGLFAPKNPPHPKATQFYQNWWLSKEGQHDFLQAATGSNSLRVDIPKDNVDATNRIDPNGQYLFFDARPDLDVNIGIKLSVEIMGGGR